MRRESAPPQRRTAWRGGLLLAAASGLLLTGCSDRSSSQFSRLALNKAASDRSKYMFNLWVGTWIAVLVTFLLVFGLIMYAVIRYRRRSDDEIPQQLRYNLPIEMLYTIAPVIVVAVFFVHTVQAQHSIERAVTPEHTVEVVGEKWAWSFDYLKDPALDGRTTVYDTGAPDDPGTLWLPVDEPVKFLLHSPDVIHDFWVPEFYFKMDVIPGKTNQFTMTPDHTGTFKGRCAEYCGLYHSRMIFYVKVVSKSAYAQHLAALKTQGQVGQLQGYSQTDIIAGLDGAKPDYYGHDPPGTDR